MTEIVTELEAAVAEQKAESKSVKMGISTVKKADGAVIAVMGKHGVNDPQPEIVGCWDVFRDRIHPKTHSIFFLDHLFY